MASLSPALLLAWDIAASEAAYARQPAIEPMHLFISLCKLEDFSSVTALLHLGYVQAEAELIHPEIDALVTVFYQYGLNPTMARRELRQRRGTGVLNRISGWTTGLLRPPAPESGSGQVIHRSQASRLIFARADELALLHGSFATGLVHLLGALLENKPGDYVTWLSQHHIDPAALSAAALNAHPRLRR